MNNPTLRIIGGQWRGRKLPFSAQPGVRPTPDRVREILFNWLMQDVSHAACLDAFAGSGALGFEALSRGCALVTFLDTNRQVSAQLKRNIQMLSCEQQSQLSIIDAAKFLAQPVTEPFDLIFIDPPFGKELVAKSVKMIIDNQWLKRDGKIYLEAEKPITEDTLKSFGLHYLKHKKVGEVYFGLVGFIAG